MKITVCAVSAPAILELVKFKKNLEERNLQDEININIFNMSGEDYGILSDMDKISASLANSDLAIIDIMGASGTVKKIVSEGLKESKGNRVIIGNECREFMKLGAFDASNLGKMPMKKTNPCENSGANSEKNSDTSSENNMPNKKPSNIAKKMRKMRRAAIILGRVFPFGMTKDMKNLFRLVDYWQQGTEDDLKSFMHLLLRDYYGYKEFPKEKPCTINYGIYLKDIENGNTYKNLSEFKKSSHFKAFSKSKGTATILFYGHNYPNNFMPMIKELSSQLSKKYNIVPIAFSQNQDEDLEVLEKILNERSLKPDVIVNTMPFRLGAGPMGGDANRAVEIIENLGVPYFKPLCVTKNDSKEWEKATSLNPGEFLISIMLPELDGGIHTYPLGVAGKNEIYGTSLREIVPLQPRIKQFCDRIDNFVKLKNKPRSEKKIALICYNYPPGEDNLFGGAFLDTFKSIENILKSLKSAGYTTDLVTGEWLKEHFTKDLSTLNLGNIAIAIQPTKGKPEEYHDRNISPDEAYMNFYDNLRNELGLDAIVHVGTHGTLEFMKGKDNAVSETCLPDMLIGNLPHFYYYYMGNPSEAMIAKRRSNAVLLGYVQPPFEKTELYGKYAEIKEAINEYRESVSLAPEKLDDLLERISVLRGKKIAASQLEAIEEELYDYENSLIPRGLHVIGEGTSDEDAETYAKYFVKPDFFTDDDIDKANNEEKHKDNQKYNKLIKLAKKNKELEALINALDGKYIPVGPAGDFTRNDKMLPAGRNLVQFDPTKVPTQVAVKRGEEIAKGILEKFYEEEGKYPMSAAVILWGLETSKTQGETIGQIMYYLGLKLKSESGSFSNRFEIIPLEKLGRPRVDVTINICGFFRDMYPNLVRNLSEIFTRLQTLNEPIEKSGFAANTAKKLDVLKSQGQSEERAKALACGRIFGPKAGEYGTKLTDVVKKGSWHESAALGYGFIDDLSYLYTENIKGEGAKELLGMSYSHVEVISQVRNNTEYELVDLDHYYEFYGGLAKAVENSRGTKPKMLVADTTGDNIRAVDIKYSIEKGVNTRLLNPRWIEGMMNHDYHGVQQISKRFENIVGLGSTTDSVESHIFSDLEKTYVEDEVLKKRMQESNKWAYMQMLNRLVEAYNRGLWDANQEELDRLRDAYLETEGDIEN